MRYLLLLITLGALAMPQFAAAEEDPLPRLRPGHPRLIVTDDRVRQTRERLQADPQLEAHWQKMRQHAQKAFDGPTVEYKLVGPRLLTQSRNCVDRVYAFAAMYRMTGERKWVDRAVKELEAAAAFPDWNPSHFLDTAEMCHAFGVGYDWLHAALTDEQRTTIRTALVEKGLKVGLAGYNGARHGWFRNAHHNWNQVCNGGLVIGALAVAEEEPRLAADILAHARASLPRAMKSFAPDGGWEEGPGYWDYTLRYTLPLILALESSLGDDLGLGDYEGFADTGSFQLHMVGPTDYPFNYADVGGGKSTRSWMMWELARRFDKPAYTHAAGLTPWPGLALFLYQPTRGSLDTLEPLDRHFRGVDVVFMRSAWQDPDATYVGFKGGDNQANHSHLDLGCFVFDALGQRWATDLGSDDYNLPDYFGKKRWTYYRLNTHGQNTLLLDDRDQEPKAKAPILGFASGDEPRAVADLTAGYAGQARRVRRGVSLIHRRQGLLVQDEIEADKPVAYAWQMHTKASIQVTSPTRATLELNGQRLRATLVSDVDARFAVTDADAPPPQAQNEGVRKLIAATTAPVARARVAVVLSPLEDAAKIVPLDDWLKQHAR